MFQERIAGSVFLDGLPKRQKRDALRMRRFLRGKRAFDVGFSLLLAPPLLVIALLLLLLNPLLNRGPLLFVQRRMGKDCVPFSAIKFRTMRSDSDRRRRADEPVELDCITPLGHFLRKSRIDELPQILNVLKGEMSLIGPRPDSFEHAEEYILAIPGYRERHSMRPGISGLAQTELGYAQGVAATRRKVRADLYYVTHASLALDAYVFVRTLQTVIGRRGL